MKANHRISWKQNVLEKLSSDLATLTSLDLARLTKWPVFLQNASGNPSYHQDLLPSRLEYAFCKCSDKLLTNHHVRKYHKGRKKSDERSKQENPYKMTIFSVGIPYSLQKPKNPCCRDFSLRVATLKVSFTVPTDKQNILNSKSN